MTERTGRFGKLLDVAATISVIGAALSVIAVTGDAWYRGYVASNSESPVRDGAKPSPGGLHPLEGAPLLGNRLASVAIIEYADFECPYCADFVRDPLPSLKERYIEPGKVLMSFRHFPSAMHERAKPAALSAECAARHGRFWAAHDLLFASQGAADGKFWRSFASAMQIPPDRLAECQSSAIGRVDADLQLGKTFQVTATPTFLIGVVQTAGTVKIADVIVGAMPLARFATTLDALLASGDKHLHH